MSLLDEAMETCAYIDKITVPDGYGGVKPSWREGAEFTAAIVFDTSMEARRAQKEGVQNLYTITTPRNITLMYGDIITRKSDGKIFKITSDGTDKKTPMSATLDMRVVTAQELDALPGVINDG